MNALDFIFFFLYVFIFYIIFAVRRRKLDDPLLRKYHKQGFWIKCLATFAYCIFVVYVSPGDTNGLYYPEGLNIAKMIMHDPSRISLITHKGADFDESLLLNIANSGYFSEESNFWVSRLVAVFSFFTFGKFMAINLVFSMIAFSGTFRLYRFFYEQYPHLHRQFAIAIIYFPTFVFWSAGILKDPICIGALGWITYCLYAIFYKKKKIFRNILLLLIFGYLLAVLKVYILVAYLPFFVLYLILKNVNLVRNQFARLVILLVFIVGAVIGSVNVMATIQEALAGYTQKSITQSIKSYQTNYQNQANAVDSNFSLGVEFDGSMVSLAKIAPAAIVATLFRPFFWESRKISTLLSSLESLSLMLFTLYVFLRVKPFRFFRSIFKDPLVTYCFFYSLVFALFVGATTLNFGTLVRYKIPAMPFYLISIFLILDINRKKKSPENAPGENRLAEAVGSG